MIDFLTAREVALTEINSGRSPTYPDDPDGFVILDEFTITRPYGWLFFWDSKAHQANQTLSNALVGNAPILVTKDGAIHVTGTAHPPAYYLDNYERTGDVHARHPFTSTD